MKRTLAILSLAALLATGEAAVAGQQAPATQPSGTPGVSTQSTGAYPGARGPTGSTQPDATNPVRSNPSGGGTESGGGASGGASGGAGGASGGGASGGASR
jgi:hypothetical protein